MGPVDLIHMKIVHNYRFKDTQPLGMKIGNLYNFAQVSYSSVTVKSSENYHIRVRLECTKYELCTYQIF